jgi:hypothetical protein
MRKRLVLSAALLSAAAVALPSATAATTPVLDGKKVKKLTLKATSTAQDNDKDLVALNGPERVDCEKPRCVKLPFVYQPAKGVKGGLAFEISWTIPVSDMDLYVAQLGKDGNSQIAACGASAGTSEKVYLEPGTLRAGKTYALIVDFYRTPGEAVTGSVTFPGKDQVKTTAPAALESAGVPINCGL